MKPVSSRCEIYDKLELACLHQQEINLVLRNGTSHQGNAVDFQTRTGSKEFLLINIRSSKQSDQTVTEVSLEDIRTITWTNIDAQDIFLNFG